MGTTELLNIGIPKDLVPYFLDKIAKKSHEELNGNDSQSRIFFDSLRKNKAMGKQ